MILFPRPGFGLVLDDPIRPPVLGGLGIGITIVGDEVEDILHPRRKKADTLYEAMPWRVRPNPLSVHQATAMYRVGGVSLDRVPASHPFRKRKRKPRCD